MGAAILAVVLSEARALTFKPLSFPACGGTFFKCPMRLNNVGLAELHKEPDNRAVKPRMRNLPMLMRRIPDRVHSSIAFEPFARVISLWRKLDEQRERLPTAVNNGNNAIMPDSYRDRTIIVHRSLP